MSFRDEMKASLKTPQQVMNEKKNAELQKIKESANAEFERMKVELKRQASEGHYVDLSTRQIVHAEITSDIQQYCDIVIKNILMPISKNWMHWLSQRRLVIV